MKEDKNTFTATTASTDFGAGGAEFFRLKEVLSR
jgi:hypothetical protein